MERKQHPTGPLEMFVVYERPRDYPAHFVVRRFLGEKPTEDFAMAETLDGARAEVPPGLVMMARAEGDDPKIVEVWL